jgi:hypothetical protein
MQRLEWIKFLADVNGMLQFESRVTRRQFAHSETAVRPCAVLAHEMSLHRLKNKPLS